MLHQASIGNIVPQFFSADLAKSLSYYGNVLGFSEQWTNGEPPFYGGAARDGQFIFFRAIDRAVINSADKYNDENLDAYIQTQAIEDLYGEYLASGVTFTRTLSLMPWGQREFVLKDCDGRLICFGEVA